MALSDLIIRPPTPADTKAMLTYMERLTSENDNNIVFDPGQFHYTEPQEQAWIESHQDPTQAILLIAEHQGRIVAITELAREKPLTRSHVAGLGISIDRAYRGQGLGTKLIGLLLAWAREQKIKRVELKVLARNTVALQLYRKFGFQEEGRHKMALCKQGHFVDDLSMALLLE